MLEILNIDQKAGCFIQVTYKSYGPTCQGFLTQKKG